MEGLCIERISQYDAGTDGPDLLHRHGTGAGTAGGHTHRTAYGLDLWTAIFVSILGNLVPVPFIIIFIKKIFAWMRRRMPRLDGLVTGLEKRAADKSETVEKYAFWGLFILVAIPLPGTGAWTGSLVAAMMDMPMRKAFPAIALGVVGAGIIVAFVTYGAGRLLFS